jgi:amino acid transporter
MAAPAAGTITQASATLVRALGVSDLTWLYLVAVVNLNTVPVVASDGFRVVWLWIAVVLFFFVPQGIGVIELAAQTPGEGGLYLWTKESFGDFHGFLCGWCYWLTNMFFVPALLVFITGIATYVGGTAVAGLNDNKIFYFSLTIAFLWITITANIFGLGVGKWVNNIGGIGALVIGGVLILMGASIVLGHHSLMHWHDLSPANIHGLPMSSFGVMCLALVGLELGPIMGDEVRQPRLTIPRAVLLGGVLSIILYIGSTVALLTAIPQSDVAVVQGLLQAIDKVSASMNLGWILLPLALLMAASLAGSTSAWVSGSARILFVCGLDRYLPKSLGKVHPRYHSPHIALAMFGLLASLIIAMSFIGASVKEAYLTLLDLAVALQMISYTYLFLTLLRRSFSRSTRVLCFPRPFLKVVASVGLVTAVLGFTMAFVPSRQIESIFWFEVKMAGTLALFLALAAFLFFYYSKSKSEASFDIALGSNS